MRKILPATTISVFFIFFLNVQVSFGQMTIVRTDSSTMSTLLSPADKLAADAAFDYAASQFTSRFTDPIQINIKLNCVAGTGTLGQSSTSLLGSLLYSQTRSLLLADATTTNDNTAYAHLPSGIPAGSTNAYWFSRAQAKALKLIPSDATTDGTFTFGAGFSYTYDPNNRAVSGKIDFIGVALHEIAEIMGRIYSLGDNLNSSPANLVYDLFRFTGPNVRRMDTTGRNVYFSIDSGATNLKFYNSNQTGGADIQDWASGTNDAFNAFSSSGVLNDLTATDLIVMDVIGYDKSATVLPVNLLYFKGFLQQDVPVVNWSVTSQEDMLNYTLERSADAINFSTINVIKLPQNAPLNQTFSYTDNQTTLPINFYRLKMQSLGGQIQYSAIIKIISNKASDFSKLLQTISHDNIKLQINNPDKSNVAISLINLSGQLIHKWDVANADGVINLSLNNFSVAGGMYLLRVEKESQYATHKIIIQ